jgi:hypothetical protein
MRKGCSMGGQMLARETLHERKTVNTYAAVIGKGKMPSKEAEAQIND